MSTISSAVPVDSKGLLTDAVITASTPDRSTGVWVVNVTDVGTSDGSNEEPLGLAAEVDPGSATATATAPGLATNRQADRAAARRSPVNWESEDRVRCMRAFERVALREGVSTGVTLPN
jgi:hypothetical protein